MADRSDGEGRAVKRQGFFGEGELVSARLPLRMASMRQARCGECRLDRGCKSPYMKVHGQGKLGLLVVGESPGADEDEAGRQFVGRSGKLLRDALVKAGASLDADCWVTNAVICRPPNNRTPEKSVSQCRPNLLRTVQALKPRAILLLGGAAIESLLGWLYKLSGEDYGATRWAGWRIPSTALDAWVCPTFHPSYVLRSMKRPDEPSPHKVLFEKHVTACVGEAKRDSPWRGSPPDIAPRLLTPSDPDHAASLVYDMVTKQVPLSYDYETDRLKPDAEDARIVCTAVSDGETSVACMMAGAFVDAVKDVLRSPVPKTCHNAQFELGWSMKRLGVEGAGGLTDRDGIDTMLATHALDYRRGTKDLEFQAFVRLGIDPWSAATAPYLKSEREGGNEINRVGEVSPDVLLRYCAQDALVGHMLASRLAADVGREFCTT